MNKKGQMELVTIAITILILGVVGVSVVIPTIISTIASAKTTFVETFVEENVSMDIYMGGGAFTTYTPIVAGTFNMYCDGVSRGIDDAEYTVNLATGLITANENYVTLTNKSWTSYNSTLVYLNKSLVNSFNDTTMVVFNCSNQSQIFDEPDDYVGSYQYGGIMMTADSSMTNNTLYCMNGTGSILANSMNCPTEYDYNQVVGLGTGGLTGTIVDLLPLLLAIVLLVAIVGYVGLKA